MPFESVNESSPASSMSSPSCNKPTPISAYTSLISAFKNQRSNCETAELYSLFPFRCYGLGRPNLEHAKNAYEARVDKSTVGWTQDGMFAALLGLSLPYFSSASL